MVHHVARLLLTRSEELRLPVQRDVAVQVERALRFRLGGSTRSSGRRVEGRGRQHLRRRVDEVQGLQFFAVVLDQVEAGDVVVGVGESSVALFSQCQRPHILFATLRTYGVWVQHTSKYSV